MMMRCTSMMRRITFSSRAVNPWFRARETGSSQNLPVLLSRSTCTCGGSLQSKLVKKNRYGSAMPLIRGMCLDPPLGSHHAIPPIGARERPGPRPRGRETRGRQRLVLRRGAHLRADRERREEARELLRTHLPGMPPAVKQDVAADPAMYASS